MPKFRDYFKKLNRVGILGAGVSGHAVSDLLDNIGIPYLIFDEQLGQELNLAQAEHIDFFVYSPGFRQNHKWLTLIRSLKKPLMAEWEIGAHFFEGSLIGVTGTNGKTTLVEFLSFALNSIGKKAIAVGNNGYPLCKACIEHVHTDCIAVCELSSFQAEYIISKQLDALLWTNIAQDHLDRHTDMHSYFMAKWNLVKSLKPEGVFIMGNSVYDEATINHLTLPQEYIQVSRCLDEHIAFTPFFSYPQQENYAIAKTYWDYLKLPKEGFIRAAKNFTLPKHRLQLIACLNGVCYWNDSKATNPAATLAALHTFNEPVYWIGGGKDKGLDLVSFCQAIAPKIKQAFLIGEVAFFLRNIFHSLDVVANSYPDLDTIITICSKTLPPGSNVLLSPGFSSLDMFKGYADRGIFFEKAVLSLKNEKESVKSV